MIMDIMISKSVFILAAIAQVYGALVGSEIQLYENGVPGYLYSLGGHGYISTSGTTSTNGNYIIGVGSTIDKASRLRIYRRPVHNIPYNIIILDDQNASKVPSPTVATNLTGLSIMSLINSKSDMRFSIANGDFGYNSFYSFSMPYSEDGAFQIYLRGGCLTVSPLNVLSFEFCADSNSSTFNRQLFQWVDSVWFSQGMTSRMSGAHRGSTPQTQSQLKANTNH
ncbi:hypothetical protein NEOKW01_1359 [Nematocida sp. AWRm80]|nr:hypothetical protein NEOKW01_1359 [Nematocida sp. AWRm80]